MSPDAHSGPLSLLRSAPRLDQAFTWPEPAQNLDVVGRLKMIFHVSTDAVDTDFVGRLSDVFPDGRHRNLPEAASLLEPNIYEFDVDLRATPNRFRASRHIRIDSFSADFPRCGRNSHRGGLGETPMVAIRTIFHDPERRSHLVVGVIGDGPQWATADVRNQGKQA
ncbi:CocE/NonD family hydrolase C-terminal non-catalytic domain-containing protein [Sphingosinicella rhizophila]|uniref:CocE/NonD family hydrolase C-terminal non-catalytic domain-containing protein n=1 Tax=Sphingosinicella rhizophila TaxID=3050082 RepID=A0ABU3Q5Q3_9SPHN|nr:CocE/NonD family hydrolase C-terminal non-catalytic domain-containing protein [Sphingosinicella sp. GR2756]MDT9598739.1 CocE/NonD family hydrolase C-terminal non-catalytic domain-containing protein [Sphingosinicella sp. GR2756]